MGNNPVNKTDSDGGFDWFFFNNETGELIQNPSKGYKS
jgi:hypothetical protein